MRKLLILSQIGSPNSPTPKDVGLYLNKFLMDPRIITAPFIIRWLLVNGLIIPRRKFSSAEKYKKIWRTEGSPLVLETLDFAKKLAEQLKSPEWTIQMHWRYGKSTEEQFSNLQNEVDFSEIYLAPLYPQYAAATTESSLDVLGSYFLQKKTNSKIKKLKPFYSSNEWINSWVNQIKNSWTEYDHILFSYHGLPQSQVKKNKSCQLSHSCCEKPDISKCYYAQCLKSSALIAEKLQMSRVGYTVSFQSRVGPTKWLEPDTESVALKLAQTGYKNILVICPSFVTDGLETLEEIKIELASKFKEAGGQKCDLVDSLNSQNIWIDGFRKIVLNTESWESL